MMHCGGRIGVYEHELMRTPQAVEGCQNVDQHRLRQPMRGT
jgi:hypothetical protein